VEKKRRKEGRRFCLLKKKIWEIWEIWEIWGWVKEKKTKKKKKIFCHGIKFD